MLQGNITRMELPEREGRPDALDLLEACIARVDGRPWQAAVMGPWPQEATLPPTEAPEAPLRKPTQGIQGDSGVRDTSRDALAKLGASGKLNRQQAAIVAFLQAHPGRGYTRAELAEATGLRHSTICGRCNELLSEPFAALEELPRRPCRVTGEAAHPLKLNERGRM